MKIFLFALTGIFFRILLLLLLLITSLQSYTQKVGFQPYKVVSLPQNAGYDVISLNKEMRGALSKNDVIRIIKSHKQLLTVPIVIRIIKSTDEIYWWRLNPGQVEKEGDFTILQSKANEVGRFYKTSELRKYFRDTIVCFDTLKIGMYLQDQDFRIEDYFVKIISAGISKEISLPFDSQNNLLITKSLFGPQLLMNATLYNSQDSNDSIAHLIILFLTETERTSLIDIAKSLREEIPNIDLKELANYLSSYIKSNYGSAAYKDIVHFLTLNP